jgi:hypothetical protein
MDGYEWLADSNLPQESSMAVPAASAIRDISRWSEIVDAATDLQLPADFETFARDPTLRHHLRSATDCYFDLASHAVEVPGGQLVHFISDSQWVRHWLIFVGADDGQAIVTTDFPVGFDLTPDDLEVYPGKPHFEVCAPTFLEFIWRWWIENEIWFSDYEGRRQLSAAESSYVEHYRAGSATGDQ